MAEETDDAQIMTGTNKELRPEQELKGEVSSAGPLCIITPEPVPSFPSARPPTVAGISHLLPRPLRWTPVLVLLAQQGLIIANTPWALCLGLLLVIVSLTGPPIIVVSPNRTTLRLSRNAIPSLSMSCWLQPELLSTCPHKKHSLSTSLG